MAKVTDILLVNLYDLDDVLPVAHFPFVGLLATFRITMILRGTIPQADLDVVSMAPSLELKRITNAVR